MNHFKETQTTHQKIAGSYQIGLFKTLTLAILCFLIYSPQEAFSQSPLDPVKVLEGKWKGKAEMNNRDQKLIISQEETVSLELNGKVIIFKGKGISEGKNEPSFQAFGILYLDEVSNTPKMHAFTADGRNIIADVEIGASSLIWSFKDANGGTIRYTMEFNKNEWKEKGEYSQDGTNWYPFISLDLKRAK